MKFIKLVPALLIISVLVISGCAQQGEKQTSTQTSNSIPSSSIKQVSSPQTTSPGTSIAKYTGTDFNVGYPSDWNGRKQLDGTTIFSGPVEKGFTVLFSVIKIAPKLSGTLENFALQQTGADVTIVSKVSTKVNGIDAYVVVFKYTDNGLDIRVKDIYVNTENGVYELIFTALDSSYEKYVQLFEDSIAIFELNPEKSTQPTLIATNNPTLETKDCIGFKYFTIKDHKLTQSSLLLDIQNGDKEVTVTGINFGGNELGTPTISSAQPIPANKRVSVSASGSIPLDAGSKYTSTRLSISYSLGTSSDKHEDVGMCTGIVQ